MARLREFIKSKNIPHCMFAGPAGIGKTSAAIVIAKEIFGENWKANYTELNASDERGIDIVRDKIKEFAKTLPLNAEYKIICLDEADALTKDAQHALRRTMETYSKNCRFILICNYSSRIIDPIQSRCAIFRFKNIEASEMVKRLNEIVKKENITCESGAIEEIAKVAEGDMRQAINVLQIASPDVKIKEIYEILGRAKSSQVTELLDLCLNSEFLNARKKLRDFLFNRGIEGNSILKELSHQIAENEELQLDEVARAKILSLVGDTEFRLNEGADPLIQITALLANIAAFSSR
ncbi:MAG: replication factor C small subunit, partial [Euryarchaeota archaeon HGW-Euryarchaeota-1]